MFPEPYIEESYYQSRLEREHKKYLRGCPWCVVCDQQIDDPKCFVVEPDCAFETCVCCDCMEKQLDAVRKVITPYLFERLAEFVEYDLKITTPHKDEY